MNTNDTKSKRVGWSAPSNIALVKYWGKLDGQIPINPSLSMTLNNCFTTTYVTYCERENGNNFSGFLFEGQPSEAFEKRIKKYLIEIITELPVLEKFTYKIESENSFPHSSGIASSASSMAALALCFTDIARIESGLFGSERAFFAKASDLARIGSGSACRSVYGGITVWGKCSFFGSSDANAVEFLNYNADFKNLCDAILVLSSGKKRNSSSRGHQLMANHPYREARITQANNNLNNLIDVLGGTDWDSFATIIENEALSLHSLMMSSSPGYFEMLPSTIAVIEKIQKYREANDVKMAFTLDAGPNIHLIYPENEQKIVHQFIQNELIPFFENGKWIDDRMGNGPKKLI